MIKVGEITEEISKSIRRQKGDIFLSVPVRSKWLKNKRLLWSKGASSSETNSDLGSVTSNPQNIKSDLRIASAHSHKSLSTKV